MNPKPDESAEPEYVDDKPTEPEVVQEKPEKHGKKHAKRSVLDPPTDFQVVVTMNRKHVKRLGKEEYKKMVKLLFKDDSVHHVDVALNDGAVIRFVR